MWKSYTEKRCNNTVIVKQLTNNYLHDASKILIQFRPSRKPLFTFVPAARSIPDLRGSARAN